MQKKTKGQKPVHHPEVTEPKTDDMTPIENPGNAVTTVSQAPLATDQLEEVAPVATIRHSDTLPDLLKRGVDQFDDEHKKYIFLYSAIVAVSGLLIRVHGTYKDERKCPNLYFLLLAAPASGKSVMMYAKRLIRKINALKVAESEQRLAEFEVRAKGVRKKNAAPVVPRPPYGMPLIPGNVTSAKLIVHLADNQVTGCPSIIVEPELDGFTMAKKKSEHFQSSDTLRKAWENEDVGISRRGNNDEIRTATDPKLALAVSGTPNQLTGLMDNALDGLFSRFTTYTVDSLDEWTDVTPCDDCINLTDFFDLQADEYVAFYAHHDQHPLEVKLSREQWKMLNDFGRTNLQRLNGYDNANTGSIIKRHVVMVFKFAMVLTAYRQFEARCTDPVRLCEDRDFRTALDLVSMSFQNSIELFQTLRGGTMTEVPDKSAELYALLPDRFTTRDAVAFAKKLSVVRRQIERYLRLLVEIGRLLNPSKGKYEKIPMSDVGTSVPIPDGM